MTLPARDGRFAWPRPWLLDLSQPIARRAYLTTGLLLALLKYEIDAMLVWAVTRRIWTPLDYLSPLLTHRVDALKALGEVPDWLYFAMAAWALPFIWLGLTLTVRRLADAGLSPWLAFLFFVPLMFTLIHGKNAITQQETA